MRTTGNGTQGRGQVADRPRPFYLAMALALGSVLLASRFLEPPQAINVCFFNLVTGFPCMTCGLTRAFHAISLGNLRAALAYHPLSLFLYGLTAFHFLVACLRLLGWRARLLRTPHPVRAMVSGTLGLLLASWIPRLLISILNR